MRGVYRLLTAAVPAPFDAWIRAHEAELAFIDDRRSRARWMVGLVPLSVTTFGRLLMHEPKSLIGGTLMRTIVATLSVVNVVAGVGLAVLYFVDANPATVALLSVVLFVQGLFTLACLAHAFGKHSEVARHIQLVGSTLSLLVSFAGMLNGMVTNLAASTTDPEYGPMTVAMLLAIHGFFSLIAFGRGDDQRLVGTEN